MIFIDGILILYLFICLIIINNIFLLHIFQQRHSTGEIVNYESVVPANML